MEDRLDLDHAIVGIAACDAAAVRIVGGTGIRVMRANGCVLAAQRLELVAGRKACLLEEDGLVLRCGHPGDRADLGIGDLAATECIVDVG
jgi:hypothetical protein